METRTILSDMLVTSAQWHYKKVMRFSSTVKSRLLDPNQFRCKPQLHSSSNRCNHTWLTSSTSNICKDNSHTSFHLQTRCWTRLSSEVATILQPVLHRTATIAIVDTHSDSCCLSLTRAFDVGEPMRQFWVYTICRIW